MADIYCKRKLFGKRRRARGIGPSSKEGHLHYYRRAVPKKLSSKFDEFLAGRPQFDSEHGFDLYPPTCCQSATFGPLFAFYCSLFLTEFF